MGVLCFNVSAVVGIGSVRELAAVCVGAKAWRQQGGKVRVASRRWRAERRGLILCRSGSSAGDGGAPLSSASSEGVQRAEAGSLEKVLRRTTSLFPLWSLLAAGVGMWVPEMFVGVQDVYLTLALGGLMLSMGLTLAPKELVDATKNWKALLLCFVGCYGVMPVAALLLTRLFGLSADFTIGLILLGIVSGGQASNLCTYIAQGDTALSVAMTTLTTLTGVFMLPLLSKLLIGRLVPVDAVGVAKSAVQVVLAPIFVGASFNALANKLTSSIEPALPVIGIIATIFIVMVSIAKTSAALQSSLLALLLPVVLLHAVGGLFGYIVPKVLGLKECTARTLSIETAFKSPALGFVLATKHFSSYGVRIPSAVSIVALAPLVALVAVYLSSTGSPE